MTRRDNQPEIIKMATQMGLDPANLTPAQYLRISLAIRSNAECLGDAARAGASRLTTSLIKVSLEQASSNEKKCRSNECGKFREMPTVVKVRTPSGLSAQMGPKIPACDACNCSGKNLISKWSDPLQGECPLGHWSNLDAS